MRMRAPCEQCTSIAQPVREVQRPSLQVKNRAEGLSLAP